MGGGSWELSSVIKHTLNMCEAQHEKQTKTLHGTHGIQSHADLSQ
jgi:hypothetical protein